MLDPLMNSPRPREEDNHIDAPGSSETREVEISELYINDDFQAEWSKTNLMATTLPLEPFPVRVPSETNRCEVTNFYEFVPEKLFEIKQEEENFLEVQKGNFPSLKIEDVKVKWITFLCHEEMEAQGDVDEHLFFSHGLNTTELIDEKKIELNEKYNLILPEARNIKNLSENSFEKLILV